MSLFCQYCPTRQADFVKILANGDLTLICRMCEASNRNIPLNKYERDFLQRNEVPQEIEVGSFLEGAKEGVLD